jgi:hypothetical protein
VLDGGCEHPRYSIVPECYRETAGKLAITHAVYRSSMLREDYCNALDCVRPTRPFCTYCLKLHVLGMG